MISLHVSSSNKVKSLHFCFNQSNRQSFIKFNSHYSIFFSLCQLARKILILFLYKMPFTVDPSNGTPIRIARQITKSHRLHWVWATSLKEYKSSSFSNKFWWTRTMTVISTATTSNMLVISFVVWKQDFIIIWYGPYGMDNMIWYEILNIIKRTLIKDQVEYCIWINPGNSFVNKF